MSDYVWPTVLLGMGVISALNSKRLLSFIGIGGGGAVLFLLAGVAYSGMPATSGPYAAFRDSTLYHTARCVIVRDAVQRHDSHLLFFGDMRSAEQENLKRHDCVEDSLTVSVRKGEL